MENTKELLEKHAVAELLVCISKELEYMSENVYDFKSWDLIDRIIDLQGVLNVALSRLYKSTKHEN